MDSNYDITSKSEEFNELAAKFADELSKNIESIFKKFGMEGTPEGYTGFHLSFLSKTGDDIRKQIHRPAYLFFIPKKVTISLLNSPKEWRDEFRKML